MYIIHINSACYNYTTLILKSVSRLYTLENKWVTCLTAHNENDSMHRKLTCQGTG